MLDETACICSVQILAASRRWIIHEQRSGDWFRHVGNKIKDTVKKVGDVGGFTDNPVTKPIWQMVKKFETNKGPGQNEKDTESRTHDSFKVASRFAGVVGRIHRVFRHCRTEHVFAFGSMRAHVRGDRRVSSRGSYSTEHDA